MAVSNTCQCTCHTTLGTWQNCHLCAPSHPTPPDAPASKPARESGGGDHDQAYMWGRDPDMYIASAFRHRLVALRGLVYDARTGAEPTKYHLSLNADLSPDNSEEAA